MSTAIVWLRNDLRLSDNPALAAACRSGSVIALYIHETDADFRAPGGAARWWLHQSLTAMGRQLARIGVPLRIEAGEAQSVLSGLIAETGASSVHWNRRYAPADRARDGRIKSALCDAGHAVTSHPGNVLIEPWLIQTGQNRPYSVFTPFWKSMRDMHIARLLPAPEGQPIKAPVANEHYDAPVWAKKLGRYWTIGEAAAQQRLTSFLEEQLSDYPAGRDMPGKNATSRLSPHLRFGEISPRQIWHAAQSLAHAAPHLAGDVDKFLSELAWRDFSYHQLYHRDDIAKVPMQPKYQDMAWRNGAADLGAWQKGLTGFPIVDAGMRELWETGYMHNRVRMLVASLLTKNLLIEWRAGEAWFWDCLVDADEANNPASWQWVAGSGLDAAPYFRVFNPVVQGERFDPGGDYVRQWVPELAGLPDKWLHRPHEAPAEALTAANIMPGTTYPHPIIDLKASRQRALDAAAGL